ncbi:MAG TPA: hypothetical protein VMG10_19365 [Gemmataceae bacterium]|nr:hypothetical protein [Gemmataceae bacterium]
MRKLIWCCLASGLLAMGSFLSLAYYACRCPDSLVGRSMQVIAEASVAIQPLSGLTSLAVRSSQANTPAHDPAGSIEECIPDDPQPVAAERKEDVDLTAHVPDEIEPDAAPIIIGEDDPMPRGVEAPLVPPPIDVDALDGQEIPPKGCPVVMPYCRDDDEEPATPPKMPRADSGDDKKTKKIEQSVFKAWIELFEESSEDKAPAVEELPMPKEEEPQAEPKCQEDSHLHEHYSGCPRTTCPYTGKSRPSAKGSEESSEEPRHPNKKPKQSKDCKDKEECPRTKGVDTMEYRKSDAGLDEYGPGPLH